MSTAGGSDRLPYLTGALGALVIAGSAVFVRLADVAPATAAIYRCAYALPALAFVAVLERRRFGPRPLRDHAIGWIAGVLFAIDLIAWHAGIDAVGAGLATVLANTQVVVVALLAWALLGERPTRGVLAAVPLVLTGTLLISGVLEADAYGDAPVRGVVLCTITALSYAGFLLVLRRGNRDPRRPAGPLLDASASAALCSLIGGLVLGDVAGIAPSWPAHGWLLVLALSSQVIAWLLISVSLPRLPAAVTSVLLTLQPVGAVMLGIVVLAEAPSSLQLSGVAVVLAGIVLAARRPKAAVHGTHAPVLPGPDAPAPPGAGRV